MDKELKENIIYDINYDRFGSLGGSFQANLISLINHIDQQDQKIEKMQKDIQNLQISNKLNIKLK